MADELLLEIVTPEEMVFSDEVEDVYIPGVEGAFGVLIGHAPLLSAVKPGELHFRREGKETSYAVGEGYAEVTGKRATVLVEICDRADRIDTAAVRQQKEAAEAKLATLDKEDSGYDKVKGEVEMAEIRLKVAEKA